MKCYIIGSDLMLGNVHSEMKRELMSHAGFKLVMGKLRQKGNEHAEIDF